MSHIARRQFRLLCDGYESTLRFRTGSILLACAAKNDPQYTKSEITSKIKNHQSVKPEQRHKHERIGYVYTASKEDEKERSAYREKRLLNGNTQLKYFESMLHKENDVCAVPSILSVTIHHRE